MIVAARDESRRAYRAKEPDCAGPVLSGGEGLPIVVPMGLSPFDRRLLDEGLGYFNRPRLASLLDLLGSSEGERVAALAAMLRNSSEDEVEEFMAIFERAIGRVAKEQARAQNREADRSDRSERRRRSRAATE